MSDFLRDFKKHTSKEIMIRLDEKIAHVWQRGTMDHCIRFSWTGKDFDNHNFKDIVERGWLEKDFLVDTNPQFLFSKLYDP